MEAKKLKKQPEEEEEEEEQVEKSTLIGLQFISTARKAGKIVTSRRVWPQRKQLQSLAD